MKLDLALLILINHCSYSAGFMKILQLDIINSKRKNSEHFN